MTAAPTTADVVVIGGGIVGAAAARSLAEAGRTVLLLEKWPRGHAFGSSHGASRIFRQGYEHDDYLELTSRALAGWRALEQSSGQQLLEATGAIDHGNPAVVSSIRDALARNGVAYELLSAEDAGQRWPGLRFDTPVLFHASGGRISSAVALEAFYGAAERGGATLRFETEVTGIRSLAPAEPSAAGTGVVVETSDGAIHASAVVVAAGSWAPHLLANVLGHAGVALPPLRVTQEQPAHFPSLVPTESWPSFVHYLPDGDSIYGLYTPGEGIKVGEHGTGTPVDPDVRDFLAEQSGLDRLVAYVRDRVPGADASQPSPISCLYDNTPTEDFVLDRVGDVTFATGFSGHGFKFAPVLGEILAGIVAGTPGPIRFHLSSHVTAEINQESSKE